MSRSFRRLSCWDACLLSAGLVAGCGKSSTSQPTAPSPPTTRQVAATVEDSTGARVAGAYVHAVRLDQASAPLFAFSNPAGVANFMLPDGRWCLSAVIPEPGIPVLVAGTAGEVRQRPAGQVDSVLFRLVVLPESIARGKILLSGRTTHDGTGVGATEFPFTVETAADGSYDLGRLPPGTWTGLATHMGFQSTLFDIVVPAAGDTVVVGTVTLVPGLARP